MHCSYECDHFKFCKSIFRFCFRKNFVREHNKQDVVSDEQSISFFYVFLDMINHDFIMFLLRGVNIYVKIFNFVEMIITFLIDSSRNK